MERRDDPNQKVLVKLSKTAAYNYGRHLSTTIPDNPSDADIKDSIDKMEKEWGWVYPEQVDYGINDERAERGLDPV